LRALNAFNPVPISEGKEPWRNWMMRTGWSGTNLLRKDSTGLYEYSPEERVLIYKEMGKMELWRKVEWLSKQDLVNNQLAKMRQLRADNPNITFTDIRAQDVLAHRYLNNLVRDAQKIAESNIAAKNPAMVEKIRVAQHIRALIQRGQPGDMDDARKTAEHYQLQLDELD